jgi:hypothetical protein
MGYGEYIVAKDVFPVLEAIGLRVGFHPYIRISVTALVAVLLQGSCHVISPSSAGTFQSVECAYDDHRLTTAIGAKFGTCNAPTLLLRGSVEVCVLNVPSEDVQIV